MDTKLQPFLRALHRLVPISKSPELRPCLADGQMREAPGYSESCHTPALGEDKKTIQESQPPKKWNTSDNSASCCQCTLQSWRECVKKVFPFFRILSNYSVLYDLPCDIIAGLTVGIMHIPQGMAYALLTQLPPVYGLYTSFFPVLVYCFFGTSRHISVGTFAAITMMVGAVVDKGHVAWQREELQKALQNISMGNIVTYTGEDEDIANTNNHSGSNEHLLELESIKLGYAMAVTFAVGIFQLLLGITRLGFLVAFLSDPLISGFTTGTAVHVMSSQMKYAFGIKLHRFSGPLKLIFTYEDFFANIDKTNLVTLSTTVVSIVFLVIVKDGINDNKLFKKKMKGIPVPGELMVIIIATVLSQHFSLHNEFNVEVIGHIPKGFPDFSVKFVKYLPDVIGEALAICFTAFAISFATAKILADKNNYTVDPNQELVAHGLSNVFGSMLSSFCSSASLSRTMVQEGAGGRTQIVGLISSLLVLIVLLVLGPLFEALPNCVLAAIVFVALKRLFLQFGEMWTLWKVSRVDCTVWLVTFLATVLLDIDLGLLVGLIYNLVPILLGTQQPYHSSMGRVPNTQIFVDVNEYKLAIPVPGIKIFRFEAPLYFANVENFKTALINETGIKPQELLQAKADTVVSDVGKGHNQVHTGTSTAEPEVDGKRHDYIRAYVDELSPPECETYAIIIDCSSVQYMDSVTVRVLRNIILEYRKVDIEVYLGNCKPQVRAMLNKSGFHNDVYRRNVCATISQAVQVAQKCGVSSRETLANTITMEAEYFLEDKDIARLDMDAYTESANRTAAQNFK